MSANQQGATDLEFQPQETAGEESKADDSQQEAAVVDVWHHSTLSYVGIFFSAIVLLVALTWSKEGGSGHKGDKYYEYGISIAVVAMFFSLAGWAMGRRGLLDEKIAVYNNHFLVVWNFVGACFMTFGSPFEVTGNGYFGSWGLVVFSLMTLGVTTSNVKETVSTAYGSTGGLFVSAIILLTAILSVNRDAYRDSKGESVYGIILTILTILVVLAFFKLEQASGQPHTLKFPTMAVFAIMWIALACLLTFRGPFYDTGMFVDIARAPKRKHCRTFSHRCTHFFCSSGNGYFAAWGGAVTSVFAAFAAKEAMAPST